MTALTGEEVARLALVDQHCHPVAAGRLDDATFEMWCTESQASPPPGVSYLDSHLGHAVRRWCAPVLDLPAHADAAAYVERRAELGRSEVTGRMLRHSGHRSPEEQIRLKQVLANCTHLAATAPPS